MPTTEHRGGGQDDDQHGDRDTGDREGGGDHRRTRSRAGVPTVFGFPAFIVFIVFIVRSLVIPRYDRALPGRGSGAHGG
jgi:hypothetical protein